MVRELDHVSGKGFQRDGEQTGWGGEGLTGPVYEEQWGENSDEEEEEDEEDYQCLGKEETSGSDAASGNATLWVNGR